MFDKDFQRPRDQDHVFFFDLLWGTECIILSQHHHCGLEGMMTRMGHTRECRTRSLQDLAYEKKCWSGLCPVREEKGEMDFLGDQCLACSRHTAVWVALSPPSDSRANTVS